MFSQLLCRFNEGSIGLKPLYSNAFSNIRYSSLTFYSISSPGRQLLKGIFYWPGNGSAAPRNIQLPDRFFYLP